MKDKRVAFKLKRYNTLKAQKERRAAIDAHRMTKAMERTTRIEGRTRR